VNDFLIDVRKLRENARADIERGPIVTVSGADLDRVLSVLNNALATEVAGIVRCRQHHLAAAGLRARPVAAEFLAHGAEEQTHAYAIAARIAQLGGVPGHRRAAAAPGAHRRYQTTHDPLEMVAENLVAKRVTIDWYTETVRWLGTSDPASRRMLGAILANERDHARDLFAFLQKMC
jgi:bacterioferritin